MNFRQTAKAESPGFQMTPMIDVVFLLLCFFVTSQLFAQWEAEINIALPTAQTGEIPQRLPGELIINITDTGQTIINGRDLARADLGEMLAQLARMFPGQPVIIRADRLTPYERIIEVLDLCRKADIWNISFATTLPEN